MTEFVGVIILIAVIAAGTCKRRIALLRAGRFRHSRLIVVAGCIDCFCVGLAAARAGVRFDAACGTGRRRGDLTVVPIMTKRVGESVLICMTAVCAGIRRIALLRAGRFRHSRLIVVAGCIDCFCVGLAAARAGVRFDAACGTGRRRGDLTVVPIMTKRVGESVLICMTAVCAGIRRIALLRAGRFRHSRLIVVAGCIDCFCVGLAAARAGVGHDAAFCTGRRSGRFAIIPGMAERVGVIRMITLVAARAGVQRVAHFRAGRFNYFGLIVMIKGICITFLKAVAAARAGIQCVALFRAGRFDHFGLIVMIEGINKIFLVTVAAARTDVQRAA